MGGEVLNYVVVVVLLRNRRRIGLLGWSHRLQNGFIVAAWGTV